MGFVFDEQFETVIASIRKQMNNFDATGAQPNLHRNPRGGERHRKIKHTESTRPKTPLQQEATEDTTQAMEPLIEFSPVTGTFRMVPSPAKSHQKELSAQTITTSSNDLPPTLEAPAVPLVPVALSDSPSILSLAETTTTSKSLQDSCQIINSQEAEVENTLAVESHPSTPKRASPEPRPSEADLLSFTPYSVSHHAASVSQPIKPTFNQQAYTASLSTSILSRPAQRPAPLPTSYSHSYIMSNTTTTTVPLAEEPSTPTYKTMQQNPSFTAGYSPGTTKTREEALQSIERWRRGRSRSVVVNGTPRRFGPVNSKVDGNGTNATMVGGKRDCSAPVPRVGRDF